MSKQIGALDLLVELSIEEQQLLSGGQDTPGGVPDDLQEPDTEEPLENGDVPIPEERNGRRNRRRNRRSSLIPQS
ncbi:hypothetical protein IQ243_16850 [Nostocales cyanobacterium LEGE 11386]|nr:hypothetical protein [Nostocales cyanobacterium LEGE 11386]